MERVRRDLLEVLTNRLTCFCLFLHKNGDLMKWVIQLTPQENRDFLFPFYFELEFSANYPTVAPLLRSLTYCPHSCIVGYYFYVARIFRFF